MPALSRRQRHLRAARQKIDFKYRRGIAKRGACGGIAEDSPLKAVAEEGTLRKSSPPNRFTPDVLLRPTRPSTPTKHLFTNVEVVESTDDSVEVKWNAVLEFAHHQDLGEMTNQLADEIASEYGTGSGSHLRKLHKKARSHGSLIRKVGSGRPRVLDHDEVNRFMTKVAAEHGYTVTTSFLLRQVKEEFNYGSHWLLQRIMQEYG